ncbi:hypothetical protein BDV35DRAFT_13918 [Aspergillus flavus]|uniref:Uncharacterized protein n=1 Tax=Aspergillus flavus TaxID=5059 RepID=A0A5N6GKK2_ASPFL|nr:hypothetical protein BDV35DRAFT_13918 [Aspergillus flavus]
MSSSVLSIAIHHPWGICYIYSRTLLQRGDKSHQVATRCGSSLSLTPKPKLPVQWVIPAQRSRQSNNKRLSSLLSPTFQLDRPRLRGTGAGPFSFPSGTEAQSYFSSLLFCVCLSFCFLSFFLFFFYFFRSQRLPLLVLCF